MSGFEDDALESIQGNGFRNAKTDEEKLNARAFEAGAISIAAKAALQQQIAKIETLIDEKKAVAEQIKDVFAESKAMGYDTKVMRAIIAERAKDAEELKEFEALKDIYRLALDMQD